jgi:hypothetical protein
MEHNKLLNAMKSLSLTSKDTETTLLTAEKSTPSTEQIHAELEEMFLTPNQQFSEHWLNKLQQSPPTKFNLTIDDGKSHSNSIHYLWWVPLFHDHEYGSSEKAWKAELRDMRR